MSVRVLFISITGATVLAFPASAGLMDTLSENSLTYTIDGADIVEHYNADGTFSNNQGASGTWTYENGVLCSVVQDVSECGPVPDDMEVGDTIDVKLEDGRTLKVTLRAGR